MSIINAQTSKPQPSSSLPTKDSAVTTQNQNNAVEEKIAPSSQKQETYKIKGTGYYGCIDKENFKRLRDILMQGDDAAFLKEMTTSVKKGECVIFNKGEKVSLEEGTVISTVIRIKKEGNHNSHWTTTKAILPQSEK